MKIAISNIAWTANEENDVAAELQKLGIRYVEIAPTRVWDNPLNVTDGQVNDYLKFWNKYGIRL